MNKIEGLIKEVPKEGIAKEKEVRSIEQISETLRDDIDFIINESNYNNFFINIILGLRKLDENNASKEAIDYFLRTICSYSKYFSHLKNDIYNVFSGKGVSLDQLEKLGFEFKTTNKFGIEEFVYRIAFLMEGRDKILEESEKTYYEFYNNGYRFNFLLDHNDVYYLLNKI